MKHQDLHFPRVRSGLFTFAASRGNNKVGSGGGGNPKPTIDAPLTACRRVEIAVAIGKATSPYEDFEEVYTYSVDQGPVFRPRSP